MKLEDAYYNLIAKLSLIYDEREAENIVKLYFSEKFNRSNPKVNYSFSEEERDVIVKDTSSLMEGVPLQYVIGKTYFYDLELKVNASVLIPRPETEELIAWILEENKNQVGFEVLDIGTGSGCIPLTLKKHRPLWNVSGTDVSESALEMASRNANQLSLDVHFVYHNILLAIQEQWKTFDLVVFNPPYILKEEEYRMNPGTVEYEPHLALFIETDDPLLFYKAGVSFALKYLKAGSPLFFEVSEFHGEEVVQLLKDNNFQQVEMRKDLQGKLRMVRGIKA